MNSKTSVRDEICKQLLESINGVIDVAKACGATDEEIDAVLIHYADEMMDASLETEDAKDHHPV